MPDAVPPPSNVTRQEAFPGGEPPKVSQKWYHSFTSFINKKVGSLASKVTSLISKIDPKKSEKEPPSLKGRGSSDRDSSSVESALFKHVKAGASMPTIDPIKEIDLEEEGTTFHVLKEPEQSEVREGDATVEKAAEEANKRNPMTEEEMGRFINEELNREDAKKLDTLMEDRDILEEEKLNPNFKAENRQRLEENTQKFIDDFINDHLKKEPPEN